MTPKGVNVHGAWKERCRGVVTTGSLKDTLDGGSKSGSKGGRESMWLLACSAAPSKTRIKHHEVPEPVLLNGPLLLAPLPRGWSPIP